MSLRHENPHVGVVLAEQLRASINSEFLARVLEDAADATGFLSAVKCRTLVLHRVDDTAVPLAASQRIASGIRNARLCRFQALSVGPPPATRSRL